MAENNFHFDIFWGPDYKEYFGTISAAVANPTMAFLNERAVTIYPFLRNQDFIVTKQHPELWHLFH